MITSSLWQSRLVEGDFSPQLSIVKNGLPRWVSTVARCDIYFIEWFNLSLISKGGILR